MDAVLDALNRQAGTLALVFSAVVALSTVVYAILTWKLVHETRLMRRAQTTPKVAVFYRNRDEWIALLDIVVKNIGLGPAFDVRLGLQPVGEGAGTEQLVKELRELNVFQSGIRFLAPGQEYSSYFTNVREQFEDKMAAQVRIAVHYRATSGDSHSDEYLIDLSEIRGMVRIGEPPLLKMAKQAEKIAQEISRIASGARRIQVDTHSSQDREQERRDRAEWLEEQRARQQQSSQPSDP